MNPQIVWFLISNFPTILKLIKALKQGAKEAEDKRKAKTDLKTVVQAIEEKDKHKLDSVFDCGPG